MLALIITITLFTILVTGVLAFIPSGFFKKSYYYGITFWSRWLPIISVSLIFVLLMINLLGIPNTHVLSFYPTLSKIEVGVLLFILPFFIGSSVCIFAYSAFLYLFVRFIFVTSIPSLGCILLISSFIIVGILADKLPWLKQTRQFQVKNLREFLVASFCIGLLGMVTYTIFNLNEFIQWMENMYDLNLSYSVWCGIVVGLFGGWILTILGYGRRFCLPLLCYPSLIFVAWVTSWPSYFLIIPFTILVAISLSETDRRLIIREE